MDTPSIQQQCSDFLKSLGKPGFIALGIEKDKNNFDVVYSVHNMHPRAVVKGMTGVLNDFVDKNLP